MQDDGTNEDDSLKGVEMFEKFRYRLIDNMKTNKMLKPIYIKSKGRSFAKQFSINSSRGISFVSDDSTKCRVTLVLPTLRKTKVFGGINTAISFFNLLVERLGADGRVLILNDESGNTKWQYAIPGYGENSEEKKIAYLPLMEKVDVREKEYVILTSWRTAFTFLPLVTWKKEVCGDDRFKMLYLIQDFEPGFFPWSTEYAIADLTYTQQKDSIVAIINSKELHDYMKKHGYEFGTMMYFCPVLNSNLRKELLTGSVQEKRKKQILIYGRPSESRNAFEIIRYALQEWSKKYSDAENWTIISLGEEFADKKLPNNVIRVKGKVGLKEYAEIMKETYAGISLMVSPHPSYPPLEMSTFGVRTITNCYENKDLGGFNKNIISLKTCDPDVITDTLVKICEEYDTFVSEYDLKPEYMENDSFERCISEIQRVLY